MGDEKVGGQKRFDFPSCVFGWRGGKVGGWKTFLFGWREKWENGKMQFIYIEFVIGYRYQCLYYKALYFCKYRAKLQYFSLDQFRQP